MDNLKQIQEQKRQEFLNRIQGVKRIPTGQTIQFNAIGKGTSCCVRILATKPPKKGASTSDNYHFWTRTCVLEGTEPIHIKFSKGKKQTNGFPIGIPNCADYVIMPGTKFIIKEWKPKHVIPLTEMATINELFYQTYQGDDNRIRVSLIGSGVPLPSNDESFLSHASFIRPNKHNEQLLQQYQTMISKITGAVPNQPDEEDDEEEVEGDANQEEKVQKKNWGPYYHNKPIRFVVNNKDTTPINERSDDFLFSKNMIAHLAPGQDIAYYYTDSKEKDIPEAKQKKMMGISGGVTKRDPVQFWLHETDGEGNYEFASVWLRLYDNNLAPGLLLHPESDIMDWLAYGPQIFAGMVFRFIGDVKDDLSMQADFSGFNCAVSVSGAIGIDLKKTLENGAIEIDGSKVIEYLAAKKGLEENGNLENGTFTYAQLQDVLSNSTPVCCLTNIKGVNIAPLFQDTRPCKFYAYKNGKNMLIYAVTTDGSPIKSLINETLMEQIEEELPKKKQKN
jgi:hypothetical protein